MAGKIFILYYIISICIVVRYVEKRFDELDEIFPQYTFIPRIYILIGVGFISPLMLPLVLHMLLKRFFNEIRFIIMVKKFNRLMKK